MKWKMSFVCPVLVQNVILKENIMESEEAGASEVPWETE